MLEKKNQTGNLITLPHYVPYVLFTVCISVFSLVCIDTFSPCLFRTASHTFCVIHMKGQLLRVVLGNCIISTTLHFTAGFDSAQKNIGPFYCRLFLKNVK